MAELVIPWHGIGTDLIDVDDIIDSVATYSTRGCMRYAISWIGHPNGYSGFCSRSGYGGPTAGTDVVSGILYIPSDGVYLFSVIVQNSSNEISGKQKTRLDWL